MWLVCLVVEPASGGVTSRSGGAIGVVAGGAGVDEVWLTKASPTTWEAF